MRHQWIGRLTTKSSQGSVGKPADRVRCGDAAICERGVAAAPCALRGATSRAQAEAGPGERVDLILDQSRASERHQVLMLALRWGERTLPLAWRVEETEGAIGFGVQRSLFDAVAAWLPDMRAPALRPALWHNPRWSHTASRLAGTIGCG